MTESTATYQSTYTRRYKRDLTTLPGRFRHVRCSASLSQEQCAEQCGLMSSSISHIETGARKPGAETLVKLLGAFPFLDLHWLLTGEGTWVRADDQ